MKSGRKWFKAYAYYSLTAVQPCPLLFSFSADIFITIDFTSVNLSITAPFTLPLLRFYQLEAAKQVKGSATLAIQADLQSEESLSDEQRKQFDGQKSENFTEDASLIYALRAAKFTSIHRKQ